MARRRVQRMNSTTVRRSAPRRRPPLTPPPEADPFSDIGDPFVGNGDEVDVEEEAVQLLSSQSEEDALRVEQKARTHRLSPIPDPPALTGAALRSRASFARRRISGARPPPATCSAHRRRRASRTRSAARHDAAHGRTDATTLLTPSLTSSVYSFARPGLTWDLVVISPRSRLTLTTPLFVYILPSYRAVISD